MVTCYVRKGVDADKYTGNQVLPCNTTAVSQGKHSSCCSRGNQCLTNSLCRESTLGPDANYFWQTGCTDETFQDPSCPKYCLTGMSTVNLAQNWLLTPRRQHFGMEMPRI